LDGTRQNVKTQNTPKVKSRHAPFDKTSIRTCNQNTVTLLHQGPDYSQLHHQKIIHSL